MPRPGTSGGGHRSSGGHSSSRVGGGHHVGSSSRPTRSRSSGGGYHRQPWLPWLSKKCLYKFIKWFRDFDCLFNCFRSCYF